MWPVNDLIGGILPRQIPVAKTLLADLCKVSVKVTLKIYGGTHDAALVCSQVLHWQRAFAPDVTTFLVDLLPPRTYVLI